MAPHVWNLPPARPETRAYYLDWMLRGQGEMLTGVPAGDTLLTRQSRQTGLTVGPTLLQGTVVDSFPYINCYRVLLERGDTVRPCVGLGPGVFTPFGARSLGTVTVGSNVLVWLHPAQQLGYILTVLPPFTTASDQPRSDFLMQGSNTGFLVDQTHRFVTSLLNFGGMGEFSAGRPLDGVDDGTQGWITETGLRLMISPWMLQAAVSEACGLFAFYHNRLCRLVGENLEVESAVHVLRALNDQLESHYVAGQAFYPWEQLGVLDPSTAGIRVRTAEELRDSPWYAHYEPTHDDQQEFQRVREFGGYLGQGWHRMISGRPSGTVQRYSDPASAPGLLQEYHGIQGDLALRVAGNMLFIHGPQIPIPKQKKVPADPTGDTPENYRFSNQAGNGAAHRVASAPALNLGSARGSSFQYAGAIQDVEAQLLNWMAVNVLEHHQEDWEVPEANTLLQASALPNLNLRGSDFLVAPQEPVMVQIDGRGPPVPIYPGTVYFGPTVDKGFLIQDGHGSRFLMAQGLISIEPSKDAVIRCGRNVIVLAADDYVVRAKNSIDLTATTKDIRIAAGQNLHQVAGLAGRGGIYLECDTPAQFDVENKIGEDMLTGGIVCKSKQGPVVMAGQSLYLRTGGGDISAGGTITLDSNKGQSSVVVHSRDTTVFAQQAVTFAFGSQGAVRATTQFGPQGALIAGGIRAGGSCLINGGLIIRGNFNAYTGSVGYSGTQGVITPEGVQQIESALQEMGQTEQSLRQQLKKFYDAALDKPYYQERKIGEDETLRSLAFTFRNQSQYGTQNFEWWETHWQQRLRLQEGGGQPWQELSAAQQTKPYPGREVFDTNVFRTQDLRLFDISSGAPLPRRANQAAYENPQFAEPGVKTLAEGYIIP